MGLLDSVIGAVTGGGQQQPQGGAAAGGLGGLFGMLTSNPQLLQAAASMLSNEGGHGGLGGLVGKFQQAGLGDAVNSWIGTGQNQPVSGDQITNALGSGTVADLASKLGVAPGEAAGQLAQVLPGLINHLTPTGEAPAGGLGNAGELMGMLGGLLHKS
ncbi:MAG: DUF937 domain-containing protein [Burkholderiaceae bacterium]|nr:MAG: DUF937 domain-containing protein [Burkholderiaceae bacterium]